MTPDLSNESVQVGRCLQRLRRVAIGFLATAPAAMAVVFFVPRRTASIASPGAITLVALVASLWVGFSATRDATGRLDRIRRAFAVHGEPSRLLSEYFWVYVAVLVRLEVMVVCGVVIAVWGQGPVIALVPLALAGVMIALTWPTHDKVHLLLRRARSQRGHD